MSLLGKHRSDNKDKFESRNRRKSLGNPAPQPAESGTSLSRQRGDVDDAYLVNSLPRPVSHVKLVGSATLRNSRRLGVNNTFAPLTAIALAHPPFEYSRKTKAGRKTTNPHCHYDQHEQTLARGCCSKTHYSRRNYRKVLPRKYSRFINHHNDRRNQGVDAAAQVRSILSARCHLCLYLSVSVHTLSRAKLTLNKSVSCTTKGE